MGRAGHNIMRFGRSDKSLSSNGLEPEAASELARDGSLQLLTVDDLEALNEFPDLL